MARPLDQAKKITILEAGRTILLRDGYASAKMSDIAAEAGVAPGTLYLHFASKESLASAISDECLNRLGTQFTRIIKKLDTPDGIDTLMDWALTIATEERDTLALAKQTKPDAKEPPQARQRFVKQLADVLDELMERGIIREYNDATDLANIVLSVVHRVVMSCAVYDDRDPLRVKTMAVSVLQHALFDDAALQARIPRTKKNKADSERSRQVK